MNRGYANNGFSGYGSGSRFAGAPITKWLMIISVVCFIVDTVGAEAGGRFKPLLAMESHRLIELWRWVGYALVDVNVISWLFSLMILYSFGRLIETTLGSWRFRMLCLYFVLGGALVYAVMSILQIRPPMTGASSLMLGLIVTAGVLYPEQKVQLLIPPVPVKLRTLSYCFVGFIVLMSIVQRVEPAHSLAHLSGVVVAYLCMKNRHWLDFLKAKGAPRRSRKVVKFKRVRGSKRGNTKGGMKARTVINLEEGKREAEVNRILEKVSEVGIGSLTDEEKEILKFSANDDR